MRSMSMTTEALHPAPLDEVERRDATLAILRARGVFTCRTSYAASAGLTITYAHLSEAADAPVAVAVLAEGLDWKETVVSAVSGTVAITTHRGSG